MKEQRDLKHEAEAMFSSLLHSMSNKRVTDPSRFKGKRLQPHRKLNSLETAPYTHCLRAASLTGPSLLHFMQCYHLLVFRSHPGD